MSKWKEYTAKQTAKRTKRNAKIDHSTIEEITVQRMESHVKGKQQKFDKIGERKFVPFPVDLYKEDLTIENIKDACQRYFTSQMEKDEVCDVLAGDRGPSCTRISQLPDRKVFYVRFVKNPKGHEYIGIADSENYAKNDDSVFAHKKDSLTSAFDIKERKRSSRQISATSSLPTVSPVKKEKKQFPKSISAVEMMRLGKVIKKSSGCVIEIHKFQLETMEWCSLPTEAEFNIEKIQFASGGFREAYMATSFSTEFPHQWVIKKYLPSTLKDLKAFDISPEEHTRKAVQAHFLAKNFALQLEKLVSSENISEYGETFKFNNIYLGKTEKNEFVTVEEFVPGEFEKHVNNNGEVCSSEPKGVLSLKAQSLVHFSYDKSQGKLMLVDIQGSGFNLYDPEIASSEHVDELGNIHFCFGNLSETAINNFFQQHQCSRFCELLKLQKKA